MRLSTATAYLLLVASSDAFQWNPLRRLVSNNNRHQNVQIQQHQNQQRAFSLPTLLAGPQPPPSRKPKSSNDDNNDTEISSVKDVDAALNEEILGALRSAEADLKGEEIAQMDDDDDDDDDDEALLIEAQREAAEAEAMLQQAEEEAAKWEQELADMEAQAAAFEAEAAEAAAQAAIAEEEALRLQREEDEKAELTSMSEAYQAALDAANDNVDLLTSQISSLESELSSTLSKMEKSAEDKERISAEYAFLAKNFGDLKKERESEELLSKEIEGYETKVMGLERELKEARDSLEGARKEAEDWKVHFDTVSSELQKELDDVTSNSKTKVEALQLEIAAANAKIEETKASSQKSAEAEIAQLQTQFDLSNAENEKTISALRATLDETRKEKSYLELSSNQQRTEAVEEISQKMNDEVANLKNVLKSLEGEMGEKERVMKEAVEGRVEMEEMMTEMRELHESLQKEKSNSAELTEEYEAQLDKYVSNEKAMGEEMDKLDQTIQALTKERDGNVKQVEALKLELQVLQSKVDDAQEELINSNAKLQKEIDDAAKSFEEQKSGMQSALSDTQKKIASLEKELELKQNIVSTTEKALKDTESNLDNFRAKYDREAKAAASLQEQLQGTAAKLAQVESSKQSTLRDIANQNKAEAAVSAAAKAQIQTLQSQTNDLTMQLEKANKASAESERRLREYENRVESMSGTLLQSSTEVQTRGDELAALKAELATVRTNADAAVAERSKRVDELTQELARAKKQYGDSLAEANVEITQRGVVLERKENMLIELREKCDVLEGAMKDAEAESRKKLEEQSKELQRMESDLKSERQEKASVANAMEGRIAQLKKDMDGTQSDAQKTAAARDDERMEMERVIASLQTDIAFEQKSKEEAMQSKSELEKSLRQTIEQLEGELVAARKSGSDAVQEKEREVASLVEKNNQQLAAMEEAKVQFSKNYKEKSDEIAKLEDMVSTLTADVEKEIKLRQDVLAGKEGVESMLQKKLDDMTTEMNAVRDDAQKKLGAQAEELKKMEADSKSTASQVEQMKKDMAAAQASAREAIDVRNDEIKKMGEAISGLRVDIANEKRLRDEAVKSVAELESALQRKIEEIKMTQQKAEGVVQEKNQQMDRMKAQLDTSTAAAGKEAEANRKLQSELASARKEMDESSTKANAEIQRRENTLLGLQKQNQQLENGKIESLRVAEAKAKEIAALQEKVSTLTTNAEKEIKLRQDILAGKEGVESMLQTKLDEMTKDANAVRADAEKKLSAQSAELKKMEGSLQSISNENGALDAQIAQLKKDMAGAQDNAQKAIDSRNAEIQKMEQVIATLKANIEQERTLRNETVTSKSELESALQKKIDELSQGMAVARTNADRAQKETEEQAAAMAALKEDIVRERKMKERIARDLKANIAQLETELKEGRANNESALKQRDAQVSTMHADLNTLSKLKDEAQTERDAIEKKLTAQNFELKNKISTFKMTADQSIKAKADEVVKLNAIATELQAKLVQETKLRDMELVKMEDSLRAKTAQVEQLSRDAQLQEKTINEKTSLESKMQLELESLRSAVEKEAQLREKALGEKASVESEMQAQLEALRNDILNSRANAEAAVNKLKEELKIEQEQADQWQRAVEEDAKVKALAAAKEAAEDDAKAKALAAEAKAEAQARAAEVSRQREKMEQQQAEQQQRAVAEDAKAKAVAAEAEAQQRAKEQDEIQQAKQLEYEAEAKAAEEALFAKKEAKELAEAEAKAKAEALVAEQKVQVQERPKPKGFGKPAMKKAATPPKKIQLEEGMTAEEAEYARKSKLLAAWGAPSRDVEGDSTPEEEAVAPAATKVAKEPTAEEAEAVRLTRLAAAEKAAKDLATAKKVSKTLEAVSPQTKKNPLRELLTPQDREGNLPERKTASAPSSQAASASGAGRKNPLTNLLQAKDAQSETSFPKRVQKATAPSSQSTSPRQDGGSPSFPKRDSVAPPSSETQISPPRQGLSSPNRKAAVSTPSSQTQTSPRRQGLSSPNRKSAVSTPSSQTTSPRQGAPAANRDPAQTIVTTTDKRNPLARLVAERDVAAAESFPARQDAPAPSSQATAKPAKAKNPLTSLVAERDAATAAASFPARQDAPSNPAMAEPESKKLSLTDLLPSRAKPIRSNKQKDNMPPQSQTKSTSEEKPPVEDKKEVSLTNLLQPQPQERAEGTISKQSEEPVAARNISLKDHIPSTGRPLGSYGNRKTGTKLGGMASPESRAVTEDRQKAIRREAMKEKVVASVVKREATTSASSPSISKLSAIIQNHNPPQRLSRDGLNKERTSMTRLGGMANNPAAAAPLDVEVPTKPVLTDGKRQEAFQRALLSARIADSVPAGNIDDEVKNVGADTTSNAAGDAAGMKKQEAFQRALLSARIANDAKAKIFGVLPQQLTSMAATVGTESRKSLGLSQILQGQNKQPTLSQQKAFANSSRRTSLFPDKSVSHMSRLLQK